MSSKRRKRRTRQPHRVGPRDQKRLVDGEVAGVAAPVSAQRLTDRIKRFATPARIVFAFISVILIPIIGIVVTSADADIVAVKMSGNTQRRHNKPAIDKATKLTDPAGNELGVQLLEIYQGFENRGFKPSHIERVEVRGFPEHESCSLAVHHLDRTVLRWREKRLLRFEFVMTMTHRGRHEYIATFIDAEGREIDHMDFRFEGTPAPIKTLPVPN